jgi:predicted RNase H-like HicB family nuclease
MRSVTLSAALNSEDSGYIALCPELHVASEGGSIDQALANLGEAVASFFERASPSETETPPNPHAFFTHFEVTRA